MQVKGLSRLGEGTRSEGGGFCASLCKWEHSYAR